MRQIDSPDGRLYEHEGKLYPGISSVLDQMTSTFLKREWPVRQAIRVATEHPHLNLSDLEQAVYVEMDQKATWGTLFHEWMHHHLFGTNPVDEAGETWPLDQWLAGKAIQVRNLVKSARGWLAEHQVDPLYGEAGVVNTKQGYAGTPDLFAYVDGRGPLCVDFKTGTDIWAKVQLQLVAYRHAETIPDLGVEVPPTVGGAVLHVRPKTCYLLPVQTGPDQWESFLYLLEAWRIGQRYNGRITQKRGE